MSCVLNTSVCISEREQRHLVATDLEGEANSQVGGLTSRYRGLLLLIKAIQAAFELSEVAQHIHSCVGRTRACMVRFEYSCTVHGSST